MPVYETVRVPLFDEKRPLNGSDGSPPTGFSTEIWNSLSDEDQLKIRQEGITWAEEQKKINAAKESWIYKTYLLIQNQKTKLENLFVGLGIPVTPKESRNLVSISAHKDVSFNYFVEEGVITSTITPPNLLKLLYIEQKYKINEKVVVTAFPGGVIDINISTGTCKVNLRDTSLFLSKSGEFGFSRKKDINNKEYQYIVDKHIFLLKIDGFVYKYKEEGVVYKKSDPGGKYEVKEVETLQCIIKTIRTEGLLVIICGAIVISMLFYLMLNLGSINLIPAY